MILLFFQNCYRLSSLEQEIAAMCLAQKYIERLINRQKIGEISENLVSRLFESRKSESEWCAFKAITIWYFKELVVMKIKHFAVISCFTFQSFPLRLLHTSNARLIFNLISVRFYFTSWICEVFVSLVVLFFLLDRRPLVAAIESNSLREYNAFKTSVDNLT